MKNGNITQLKLIREVQKYRGRYNGYFERHFYKFGKLVFRVTYDVHNGSSDYDCKAEILNSQWDTISTLLDLDFKLADYITDEEKFKLNAKEYFKLMKAHISSLYENKNT